MASNSSSPSNSPGPIKKQVTYPMRRRSKSGDEKLFTGRPTLATLAEQTLLAVPLIDRRNARSAPTTPEIQRKMFTQHAGSTSHLERLGTTPKIAESFEKQNSNPDLLKVRPRSLTNDLSPRLAKSNIKFHKCFKRVPSTEVAIDSFSCALVADLLLTGHIYITENWFCFYAKILGREKQVEIPVCKVQSISRKKTAFIIPNAIKVQTDDAKYVFGSLISRDSAYKLMCQVWKQAGGVPANGDRDDSDENSIDTSPDNIPSPDSSFILNGDAISADFSQASEEGSELSQVAPDIPVTLDNNTRQTATLVVNSNCTDNVGKQKDEIDNDKPVHDQSGVVFSMTRFLCFVIKRLNLDSLCQAAVHAGQASYNRSHRPSFLLTMCSILIILFMMSGLVLTYRILLLEAQLQSGMWSTSAGHNIRMKTHSDVYHFRDTLQASSVQHLNTALEAHVVLLQEMHKNLKSLSSRWHHVETHIHDET